ncbi:hypothetical protein CFC21_037614 [Triticum aestivum]|uniref:Sulfotransferase n=3 Tax=Triticum TaxID=4564 RepID=A0A9R0RXA1_TRITD|nr:hypothetical protein CFC21_037614 [Triticum aestivum]VAH67846.1 unnamed protein product [Triticum turgidum subsp. durum]
MRESLVAEARGVYVMYQGCWLRPRAMQSVKLVQEHFKARPDDTLLATFPKCGTTWLKALAFTITNRFDHAATNDTHPLLTRHPQDLVPFLEMPYRQLHPIADLEKLASPRLLATHMPITLLPPCMSSLSCRVVYLFRDPKDVFVSLWQFSNEEMRAEPVKHVKMLAKFLGVPFTEEEMRCGVVEGVLKKSSAPSRSASAFLPNTDAAAPYRDTGRPRAR